MDANSDIHSERRFEEFTTSCALVDLHRHHPPPSTYIGSSSRRIDYILCSDDLEKLCVRSGSLSYQEGPQSDHRGLYVDLCINEISKNMRPQQLSSPSHRALHTNNPELVSTYIRHMKEYYASHNMLDRMNELYKNHTSMSKSEILHQLIKWDEDQGRAMKNSEKRLTIPPKKFAWSPQLRNAAVIRRYWILRLREIQDSKDYTTLFTKWQARIQRHDQSFSLPFLHQTLPTDEIRRHLNQATRHFRRCQVRSQDLRLQSYEDLLDTYAQDESPLTKAESERKATIVRRTIQTESCRAIFKLLHTELKAASFSQLSKILVPCNTDSQPLEPTDHVHAILTNTDPSEMIWDTVIEKADIEKHLLTFNRDAFRAAASSPCGKGTIHDALTYSSLSTEAKDMLAGIVPPHWYGDDELLKEFLLSFTIPPEVLASDPISIDITENDVLKGFSRWKESTTTSPSGRHLGHYRALIQDPDLLRCLQQFLSIVLAHGLSLPRWSNATNVMIEKDPGKPHIHRLRIIHLFEADFNFFLKLMWGHRLVKRADELDLLHAGQHGSTPRRTTMDPIMMTQLTTDMCRIMKINLLRFDNDASACYDRIIVALGMMAARRCGMPDSAISSHATALELMKYTVKTLYGVSNENYHGTSFEPLFGTGQGSGASPAVWLSLVVLLLHTLDKVVPERMTFQSPELSHSRLVDAFVDDTYLGFTDSSGQQTLNELIHRLQEVSQTWSHLLHLSGGKLNLSKCNWYAMYWEWHSGRPRLRNVNDDDCTIELTAPDTGHITPIKRVPLDRSSRILGVFLNPLGNFSDHTRYLKQKSDALAIRMLSPRLKSSYVRIFHKSIYVPMMRYSLPALSVQHEESLHQIQSRIIPAILQKLNINAHLPTEIRHGPAALSGMELYDVRTEVGIEQIKYLRNAIFSDSATGQMIRINLHHLQTEAGVSQCLLEEPTYSVPYLTPCWLLSVRNFLAHHNVTISITDQPTLTLQTPDDCFIMQQSHLARYTLQQQRDINLVRMYLQVSTLADMTDPERLSAIRLQFLDGRKPQDWKPQHPHWPRQETPTSSQRRLWKRYLVSSFLRYIPFWKAPPLREKRIQQSGIPLQTPIQPTDYHTLREYLKTLPRSQKRLVDDVQQVATDVQVWRAFRSREQLYVASDGGLSGSEGTFGWIIATKKLTLFECAGPVDGPFDTNSSTRCEIAGFASSLLLLVSIARHWGLRHRCRFKWITDSKAALSRVQKLTRRGSKLSRQPNDADLLSLISHLIQELHRPLALVWTKGHQDSLKAYDTLSRQARLNVSADFLATRYRLRGKLKSSRSSDHQPTQKVSISINGTRLTGQYDECLRHHVNGYHLRMYIQRKRKWSDKVWDDVDFDLFSKHYRGLRHSHQIQHMKFVHDQLPLGWRRQKYSESAAAQLALCPCCLETAESNEHFLRCQRNDARISGFKHLLSDKKETSPHLCRCLVVEGIKYWHTTGTNDFHPNLASFPHHMRDAITKVARHQSSIGWDNLLKGYLSKAWTDLAAFDNIHESKYDVSQAHMRLRRLVKAIHVYTRSLWTCRNEKLHSRQSSEAETVWSTSQAEIRNFYFKRDLVSFEDQHLFRFSLEHLLRSSRSTQIRWLRRAKASSKRKRVERNSQTLMTRYFMPVPQET